MVWGIHVESVHMGKVKLSFLFGQRTWRNAWSVSDARQCTVGLVHKAGLYLLFAHWRTVVMYDGMNTESKFSNGEVDSITPITNER